MESIHNNRSTIYDAVNDFTERDKVLFKYNNLLANKFKSEVDDLELERHQALNTCVRTAIRDLSVWMIFIALFILALIISVQWVG